MNDNREFDDLPGGPLRERVKELKCLQGIVAVLDTPGLPPEKIFRSIIEIVPSGWQYPELCQVRITYRNEVYQSPGFTETPWIQRVPLRTDGAPVGSIEVSYSGKTPGRREDPFLLEEKKLIELTANRLGLLIREWEEGGRAGSREAGAEPGKKQKPEWIVIMDLLKETDPILYKRILRRMMNHLHWQGVPGIQGLLLQFTPEFYAGWPLEIRDENQPVPRRDVDSLDKIFEEALWIASVALPANEMSVLIKSWMRQDRFGYFLLATEKRDISLVAIKEIINRFCRSTSEEEQALSASDDLQARVALIRRFLSERLRFIRVARDHMTLRDFDRLLNRVMGPSQGTGKLGGKASGLIVGESILRRRSKLNPGIGEFRIPNTWYIASDGLIDFIHYNFLEDFESFKFLRIEEIKHNYPYLQQVCKHSFFSPEMFGQLKLILDDMGEGPLIVRSSSLLEDSRGTAFSGKYRSLFLANTGSKEERLTALVEAVSEVYASIFNPDAIQYRAERGLLDYYEEMGILIQHVVGQRVGRYFFPAFAGVAFCNNEFRWSPRLRREDGVLRIVTGLGTRAVDRVENDYPALISPGQPAIRVNVMPEEAVHYAQRYIDVINMDSGRLETRSIDEILEEVGDNYPLWNRIFSITDGAIVRKPNPALDHPGGEGMIAKFEGLVEDTGFIRQMKEIMRELKETFGTPMDIEFAHDGTSLYILQCRPQSFREEDGETRIPKGIPAKMKLFSANRFVMNGRVKGIRTIVYIDPERYGAMSTQGDMVAVGDAVSRLNDMLPKKSFILMGPGRWGSRGDVRLGVKVGYSDINNSAMLVEIARKVGNYVPDLSFGTHFFQDLVEADIRYLALYPDEEGAIFAQDFFKNSPNSLANLLPECEYLSNVIKVIDVPAVTDGCEACIVMDGDGETGLGFLCRPGSGV
ncbi:MAG: PEP/pyruvate-binding domain-containing protein [Candidatus Aminicenantales bacterium]